MSIVARFEIRLTRCLDEQGRPLATWPADAAGPDRLVELYRLMTRTRVFDAKAIALQRTGQLGTYASSLGQEAVGAVLAASMRPEDVLVPSYREQAAQIGRGTGMTELLLYWGGDERGSGSAVGPHDFPVCVPIATQCCHAVGAAVAVRNRRESRVVVVTCGDGATSKGDFHEALNLAGVWRLPVVFVVSNNQWAISVPRDRQSAAATLAQKAIAAGIDGEQVDGNDVVALHSVLGRVIERARAGGGPALVEALTYRLHDHTTADDASRYRDPAEVESHRALEPLVRLRRYLESVGVWDEEREQALQAACREEVETAVAAYQATPPEPPVTMFDHLYAELPAALAAQRAAVAEESGGDG